MKRHLLTVCLAATTALAQGAKPSTPPTKTEPAKAPPKPAAALTVKDMATPESVLYDAETDTYLVSNINGAPLDKDNNGFIAQLSPDGAIVNAKLVEGGKNGVTLNAPKGTAIKDGVLYVADIDTVRLFDRKTGAPKGEVALKGSTFVNDVAAGPDGKLYVTDSGLNAKFEGTGTDAIWVITPGKKPTAKALVKSKELKGPNGVLATKDAVHVVTFGANELLTFDLKGKKVGEPTKLPNGGLDGLVALGDELLISSWGAKTVYRGKLGGEFKPAIEDVEAPADIGLDTKRSRVLVPRFQAHLVEAWELK
ncbi:MAG: SMP-30/gluconolactonase/LRE family protein [Myxococcota bacterium]